MNIYTKKGDDGTTAMMDGKRIAKNNKYVHACGELDELNAFSGLVKSKISAPKILQQLHEIQCHLFTAGAMLADKNNKTGVQLQPHQVQELELAIDKMQTELPPLTHFILPAGSTTVSFIHVCRSVCRRAERALSALHQEETLSPLLLQYMNRLSDYYFVLARYIAHKNNEAEEKWLP